MKNKKDKEGGIMRVFIGDKPIGSATSVTLNPEVQRQIDDIRSGWSNNQSYTASCEIEESPELRKFMDEYEKMYADRRNEIEASFRNRIDENIRYNADALSAKNYPDEFKKWIDRTMRIAMSWAMHEGWNMCYQYHKDIIENR